MKERLSSVPLQPGVYMYKDKEGQVIYVGKARALRSRMRSYFQDMEKLHPKVRALMKRVADFDYIVTGNEMEALILENNLIKSYQPRYNIQLRDDKTYPYLKISTGEKFPRLALVREKKDGVSRYFGPYTDVTSLRETMRLLKSLFPLRVCRTLRPASRPCLNHDLGLCLSPCTNQVSEEQYRQVVEAVLSFLEGDYAGIYREKEREMKAAAARMDFEQAARLRDQLSGIKKMQENQQVTFEKPYQLDIIGLVGGEQERLALVFKLRGGKVVAKDSFWLKPSVDESPAEMTEFFLRDYYDDNPDIPPEIILNQLPEGVPLIAQWLKSRRGSRVTIRVPARGDRKNMLDMVLHNAGLLWEEKATKDRENSEALLQLSRTLDLDALPERIECYDISHLGGEETVASMVVFSQGVPDRKSYRRFKIRLDQNDDFASMGEVLERRLYQARAGNPAFLPPPDLILIDGGPGQLNSARAVLDQLGLEIPLCSLAKKNEAIYLPGSVEPLVLPRRDAGLKLLQRLRDEAHRFAIEYNRKRRGHKLTRSALDQIEGIGTRRRQALLQHFGSASRVRQASLQEIVDVPGMNRLAAQNVYRFFHPDNNE